MGPNEIFDQKQKEQQRNSQLRQQAVQDLQQERSLDLQQERFLDLQQESFLNLQQEQNKQAGHEQRILPAYSHVLVLNREQRVQDAMNRRTISAILTENINDADSKEMAAVKERVGVCNEMLKKELSTSDVESVWETIRYLKICYMEAIDACQYYCDHKNPLFEAGKQRKKAVSDTLDLLKKEMQLFPEMNQYINADMLSAHGEKISLINLIEETNMIKMDAQTKKEPADDQKKEEQKDPVESLEYQDFAKMLTMNDADRLEFRGWSLRVVKSSIFSEPANILSENNKKMVNRFIAVAIDRIALRQDLSEEQKVNMKMRLLLQLDVKALATQTGAVPVSRLRESMEMVDHIVSDVDAALQKEKHASPMEHRLAMTVNEKLSIPSEQEKKTDAVYKKLQELFKDAEKEGVSLPSVSREDLQKVVAGGLYTLRDEVFHNLEMVCKSMNCLNGGKVADFNKLAADEKAVGCMMALCISRMTASTSAWAEAADYKLRSYMTHITFKYCGKAALENEFMKTRIFALSNGGNSGLDEQVLNQLSRKKQWKGKSGSVLNGMEKLGEVCSLLDRLGSMQTKAFSEGLTKEEAEQLKNIGMQLQNITDQKEIVNDMKLVAENLKGTRFAEGFGQLQNLIQEPGVFIESTAKIAAAATIVEEQVAVTEKSPLVKEQEKVRAKLGMDITDKIKRVKVGGAGEVLSRLQGKEKEIAAVLLQEKKPSELIKKCGDENAKEIASLYYALRSMNEGAAWADITMSGKKIVLTKMENEDIELRIGNERIPMPFSTAFLAYHLEQDVSEHLDKYGDDLAGDILQDAFDEAKQDISEESGKKASASRTIYLNILKQKTGFDVSFFRNISVEVLAFMAEHALHGTIDKEGVKNQVEALEDPNQVMLNEKDTLEMLKVMEQQKKMHKDASQTVVMPQKQKEQGENQWAEDEAELMELISDMIFSKDTWKQDLEQREPADRLRILMYAHSELLAKIIKKPELIDQTFQKLQLPGVEGMADAVKQQFDELLKNEAIARIKFMNPNYIALILKAVFGDEQDMENAKPAINIIKNAIRYARRFKNFLSGSSDKEEEIDIEKMLHGQKESMMKMFEQMDHQIEEQTKMQVDQIQSQINESVEQVFDAKDMKKKSLEDMELKEILEKNVKGGEGQGKFFKLVLTQYFKCASIMDQRAMIASAMRDAKPGQVKEGEEQSEEVKNEQMGAFLGGFFKGAGPLLHKTLQGLPMDGMPETLKIAIGDMKSKLLPISPEIVEARMDKMIMNSKGMITKIEVQRSLGAASIGQAFLCKIYGPNLDQNGKDVVIKLLRPDVQNRMEREKSFMLKCAKDTDDGMLKTFQGQLQSIEQELDLRIEARNVELGKVYNKGAKTVQSMKLVDLVSPDINALMLERAPGITVDKYMEEVRAELKQIKREYDRLKIWDGGYTAMRRLHRLKEQLAKRQRYLVELSKKWVTAGIYEEGFYHGDLHAGNIMVSDEGATVIDFGNATKITKEQQKSILHMVCAVQAQNIDGFRHHFHKMLSPESEQTYQQQKEKFNSMLTTILFKDGDIGMRIAVILAEAQKLGLELPAAIHNFSQCQVRLKNTVDDMAAQIDQLETAYQDMREKKTELANIADPFARAKEDLKKNMEERAGKKDQENQNKTESLEELVHRKLHEKREFDQNKYGQKIYAAPTQMGTITDIHICLMKLNSTMQNVKMEPSVPVEDKEAFHEVCIRSFNDFYNGLVKTFHVETDAHKTFRDKFLNRLEQPVYNVAELDEIANEIYTIPINDTVDPYMACLGKFLNIDNQPISDEKNKRRNEAKIELVAEAKKLYDMENVSDYEKMQQSLLTDDVLEQKQFESMMQNWFEDQDNHGEELRQAYKKIRDMKKSGEKPEAASEPVEAFMELFEKSMVERAVTYEKMTVNDKKIQSVTFFGAMQEVVKSRMKQTAKSLGWKGFYRYVWKNNKNPNQERDVSARLNKMKAAEEILNVMFDLPMFLLKIGISAKGMAEALTDKEKAAYQAKINAIFAPALNKEDDSVQSLPERLENIELSDECREKIDAEIKNYEKTKQIRCLYNMTKALADFYAEQIAYLPSGQDKYAESDWDNCLNMLQEAMESGVK